ncbi:MAG TPA: S-methyl-5'-thioadenosine phosphorylase [Tepidisphaeraceae bacterium]|jgi:5'-methylthioadenosine phosphorylase
MSDLRIGLIGGTGLGQALASTEGHRHELDTPFGRPADAIIETTWAGVPVFVLSRHGPGHVINPTHVPFRANLFALKQLGVTHILASGAVGSLREEFRPRDLVIPDQVIDKTYKRAATFYDKAAVHVEFAEPFCPILRQTLLDAAHAQSEQFRVHDRGCYVCMEGPAFSTRAESLMHRLWGGDLIGMTAMPEAKLAKEAEIPYALVALVTDYDCWRQKPANPLGGETASAAGSSSPRPPHPSPPDLLREILANLQAATQNAVGLMKRAVELMATRREVLEQCPARHALELAIWSDKSRIDPDEVQRLKPLWVKYFESAPQQP